MRQSSYSDASGRNWAVLLPDGVPDSDASMGLPLGPPDLSSLELPEETAIRLHNQLFARRLFTYAEATSRRLDIFAALQAAFRVDTGIIIDLYNSPQNSSDNGTKPVGKKPRRKVNG